MRAIGQLPLCGWLYAVDSAITRCWFTAEAADVVFDVDVRLGLIIRR